MSRMSRKIVVFFPIMLMAAALSGCDECKEGKATGEVVKQIRTQLTSLMNDRSPARLTYCSTLAGEDGQGGLRAQLQAKIDMLTDGLNHGKFSDYRGAAWSLQQNLTILKDKIGIACDYVRSGMDAHATEITFVARDGLHVITSQVQSPGTEFIHNACDKDTRFAMLDQLDRQQDDPRDPRPADAPANHRPDGLGDGSGSASESGSATI